MSDFDSITWAETGGRKLIYVDDAPPQPGPYGCFCPACHQSLIPVRGEIVAHHFRHERGSSCTWAFEAVIQSLVGKVLSEIHSMTLPELNYMDEVFGTRKTLSKPMTLAVTDIESRSITGRSVPEIVITCKGKQGSVKQFAILSWASHAPKPKHFSALEQCGCGCIGLDFKKLGKHIKEGYPSEKHYDRVQLCADLQNPDTIAELLLENAPAYKGWLFNARRDVAERKSKAEAEQLKRDWAAKEEARRKTAEAERLAAKKKADEQLTAWAAKNHFDEIEVFERGNGRRLIPSCPFNYVANPWDDCRCRSAQGKCPNLEIRNGRLFCNGAAEAMEIIKSGICPVCGEGHRLKDVYYRTCDITVYGCDCGFGVKKLDCKHEWVKSVASYAHPEVPGYGLRCSKCGIWKP